MRQPLVPNGCLQHQIQRHHSIFSVLGYGGLTTSSSPPVVFAFFRRPVSDPAFAA
jgi:hypothetical protein